MSKANDKLDVYLKDSGLVYEREYKPFEIEYVKEFGSTKGIRAWMRQRNFNNFVLDFAFPDVMIYVEVQGFGFGHRGKGSVRDYKKNNQMVLSGWVGLVYPATEINQNPEYIVDQIKELWEQRKKKL